MNIQYSPAKTILVLRQSHDRPWQYSFAHNPHYISVNIMLKIIWWTDQWNIPVKYFIFLSIDLNSCDCNIILKAHLFQASKQWGSQAETARGSSRWAVGSERMGRRSAWATMSHLRSTSWPSGEAINNWQRGSITTVFREAIRNTAGTIGQSVTPLCPATSWVRMWWANRACEYTNCIQPPRKFLLWIEQSYLIPSFIPGYFFSAFCIVKANN